MIHFFKRIKWKTEVSVTAFFLIVITVIVIDSVIDSLFYQALQSPQQFVGYVAGIALQAEVLLCAWFLNDIDICRQKDDWWK